MSTQSFISCHPYRSIRKQIYHCHKNGQCQPRVIIWTKPQGMGIQPLGTSSGSILKLLLFPSFCISSRKIIFALLFYMVFCFISYMFIAYLALGQDETILGDNFVDGSRKVLSIWSLIACFKNLLCPPILCTLFHDFLHVYSSWAGADNTLGPTFWCQQEGLITLVICSTSDFIDIL